MRLARLILAPLVCVLSASQFGYSQDQRQLLEAAEQLEQLGLGEAAGKIRGLAGRDPATSPSPPTNVAKGPPNDGLEAVPRGCIAVRAKFYEYQPARLGTSGLPLVALKQLLDPATPTNTIDEHQRLTRFIEVLRSLGLAEVVAAPVLLTQDGQAASVMIGEPTTADTPQAPAGAAASAVNERCALRFACTPKLLDGNRIRIDFHVRRTFTSQTLLGQAFGGPESPTTIDVRSQVEMLSGQTLVIAGVRQADGPRPETALLVLVTVAGPARPDVAAAPNAK